jgi:hypothetical protein
MHSPDEIKSVCDFLKNTPEGSLRKMLVTGEMTDAHFRILMKLAKGGPEQDFIDAFTKGDMGKLRLSSKETPLKDTFWDVCKRKWITLGLLPAEKAA